MPRTVGGRWYLWLVVVSAASTVAPIVWICLHYLHAQPTGDALYFHYQAQLIANGSGWFISPFPWLYNHQVVQSAEHPPLWILVLAFADTIGIKSYPSQLFFACFLGAAAVFVTGLAGREVGGRRVGMIAAVLAAIYPNYWINDFLGLSETLVLLLIAAVILVATKLWKRPTLKGAVVLGLLCGLAADTRAEQVLLLPLVVAPLLLFRRGLDPRRRIGFAVAGGLSALLLIAPWVGFNLSRFSHHVYFSTDSGQTLAMANCRATYYRSLIGSGDFYCIDAIKAVPGDESAQNAHYEKVAKAYINEHSARLPFVVFARVGREFGYYTPMGELMHENAVNKRPTRFAEIGLAMYYAMVAASVYGALVLWRRKLTVIPYVGILLELVITAAVTYGQVRYRAPFEVVLVVLSGVALDALWVRRSPRRGRHAVVPDVGERPAELSVSTP